MFDRLLDKLLRLLKLRSGHGFIKDVIDETHYFAGDGLGLGASKIIRPDGQWDEFLPDEEKQKRYIETMNCTTYGTLNALEILAKTKYKVDKNWSERYIGVLARTTRSGNSPHRVAEAIRANGNIDEILLPFNDNITSWWKYYSPKPMEQQYLDEGKRWLNNWDFEHKWTTLSSTALMEALKYSVLGWSVNAWYIDRNGFYYRPQGTGDNHWTVCYGYVEGEYWKIFDSYEPHLKKVRWDSRATFAKKYLLIRLNEDTMAITIKKKDNPQIYIVSGKDSKQLYWVVGWESYRLGLDAGWLKPFIEVDDLDDYVITGKSWTIGQ